MAAALLDRGPSAPQPEIAQPASERFMPGAKIVALSLVKPNPKQPRKYFDPESLEELAASIRNRGVMQPLMVRPSKLGYSIIMGERRYRAALLAGLDEVPVVVREVDDTQAFLDALAENLQRQNLSDEDEAAAYQGLLSEGFSTRQIAEHIGVANSRVSRVSRVYQDPVLAEAVISGELTRGQAQELLVAPNDAKPRLVQFVAGRRKERRPVTTDELRNAVQNVRGAVAGRNSAEQDGGSTTVAGRNSSFNPSESQDLVASGARQAEMESDGEHLDPETDPVWGAKPLHNLVGALEHATLLLNALQKHPALHRHPEMDKVLSAIWASREREMGKQSSS